MYNKKKLMDLLSLMQRKFITNHAWFSQNNKLLDTISGGTFYYKFEFHILLN